MSELTVTIISGGFAGYSYDQDGDRWARWTYTVDVNGSRGVNTVLVPDEWAQENYGVDADDPSIESDMEDFLIEGLEQSLYQLGGIAYLDGTPADGSSSDGTVVADGSSTDGSSSDGTASSDGSSSDGSSSDGDGSNHTGVLGEST